MTFGSKLHKRSDKSWLSEEYITLLIVLSSVWLFYLFLLCLLPCFSFCPCKKGHKVSNYHSVLLFPHSNVLFLCKVSRWKASSKKKILKVPPHLGIIEKGIFRNKSMKVSGFFTSKKCFIFSPEDCFFLDFQIFLICYLRIFIQKIKNNRVLTYEGCFAFHLVANAKENRLHESITSLESHTFQAA